MDSKHDLWMISGGRQDLVLETEVANMEIKMGIKKKKGTAMVNEGINKEADTDRVATMEIKAVKCR
eukprot:4358301-Ditylum_brightwellii.AAC.1